MKTRLMSQNTPLHKLCIEFFINRNHVNRQHEERDEPNHGVGRPIATAGLGVPSGLFNDFGDVFVTATGCRDVIAETDFKNLKDGAILANSGHFDVEIATANLDKIATAKAEIRPNLMEYTLPSGKQIYLLAQGRLVGQSAAEASPADIMDLTFTLVAVTVEWTTQENGVLTDQQVYLPPAGLTERVASTKLDALGLQHDALTTAQEAYVASWTTGT